MSLVTIAETVGRFERAVLQLEKVKQIECLTLNLAFLAGILLSAQQRRCESLLGPKLTCEANVIQDIQPWKKSNVLKCARDPRGGDLMRLQPNQLLRIKRDPAAHRLIDAGQQVEACRLAGAVRPYESIKSAARQLDRKVLDCFQATKRDADIVDIK